ncbi:response regulator [bacterium]|nr:response regulator [bacterium]
MTKKKILIVDDEKELCDTLKKLLAEEGYRTFSAHSGQSALKMIKKEKPGLVLLDIYMPKMDGIAVLSRVKKIDKKIVMVMMTAYGTLDTAKKTLKLGAYDYITKPFDINFIKIVVKNAFSGTKRGGINKNV